MNFGFITKCSLCMFIVLLGCGVKMDCKDAGNYPERCSKGSYILYGALQYAKISTSFFLGQSLPIACYRFAFVVGIWFCMRFLNLSCGVRFCLNPVGFAVKCLVLP